MFELRSHADQVVEFRPVVKRLEKEHQRVVGTRLKRITYTPNLHQV